jgi:hypothetical protein
MLVREFKTINEIDKYLENCFMRFERKKKKIIKKIEDRTGYKISHSQEKINPRRT